MSEINESVLLRISTLVQGGICWAVNHGAPGPPALYCQRLPASPSCRVLGALRGWVSPHQPGPPPPNPGPSKCPTCWCRRLCCPSMTILRTLTIAAHPIPDFRGWQSQLQAVQPLVNCLHSLSLGFLSYEVKTLMFRPNLSIRHST